MCKGVSFSLPPKYISVLLYTVVNYLIVYMSDKLQDILWIVRSINGAEPNTIL